MITNDTDKQEETAAMVELYEKFRSISAVANRMGCSSAKVSYRLRQAGVEVRKAGRPRINRRASNVI